MLNSKNEVLMISRQLTPEHQADLLTWANLAYVAESSARKYMNFGIFTGINSQIKAQDLSCEKLIQRSKK